MTGWETTRAVRVAEVAVSRHRDRSAVVRVKCQWCKRHTTRVAAVLAMYLLWLTGGLFGLHWWLYAGFRRVKNDEFCI